MLCVISHNLNKEVRDAISLFILVGPDFKNTLSFLDVLDTLGRLDQG